jgi:hypothetical protein
MRYNGTQQQPQHQQQQQQQQVKAIIKRKDPARN